MSVRAGREFLAIPGPTTMPDEVLRAMHRPAVDIYSGPLLALTDGLLLVRYLFGLRASSLVTGIVGPGAARATAVDIEAYIRSLMP